MAMTHNQRLADLVLAHFGVPHRERAAHIRCDGTAHHMARGAVTTYRAIWVSLSLEERVAAEAAATKWAKKRTQPLDVHAAVAG